MEKHEFITEDVKVAYHWLQQGKILAYPTESVWGIGCNPFDERAVNCLLTLKSRPIEKGLIVLTSCETLVKDFWETLPSDRQQDILDSWSNDEYKQQANTWLLEIPEHIFIPDYVKGAHDTLAIRVINQARVGQLCDLIASNGLNPFGFLVSTSCNIGGEMPACDFETAFGYFGDQICYLVGETLKYNQPSQIRDGVTGKLLRL